MGAPPVRGGTFYDGWLIEWAVKHITGEEPCDLGATIDGAERCWPVTPNLVYVLDEVTGRLGQMWPLSDRAGALLEPLWKRAIDGLPSSKYPPEMRTELHKKLQDLAPWGNA